MHSIRINAIKNRLIKWLFSTFNVTFYFWLKIVKFYAFQIHKDYEDCLLEWWIFNFQLCSVKVFEAFLYNLGLHFRLMNIYVYSEFINFEQVFKAFLFLLVINLYVSVLIFFIINLKVLLNDYFFTLLDCRTVSNYEWL